MGTLKAAIWWFSVLSVHVFPACSSAGICLLADWKSIFIYNSPLSAVARSGWPMEKGSPHLPPLLAFVSLAGKPIAFCPCHPNLKISEVWRHQDCLIQTVEVPVQSTHPSRRLRWLTAPECWAAPSPPVSWSTDPCPCLGLHLGNKDCLPLLEFYSAGCDIRLLSVLLGSWEWKVFGDCKPVFIWSFSPPYWEVSVFPWTPTLPLFMRLSLLSILYLQPYKNEPFLRDCISLKLILKTIKIPKAIKWFYIV